MLRSNSKSLGNHVVSPEEEEERLQWEGFTDSPQAPCIIKPPSNMPYTAQGSWQTRRCIALHHGRSRGLKLHGWAGKLLNCFRQV